MLQNAIEYIESGGEELYRNYSLGLICLSGVVFVLLVFVKAPYGRYTGTLIGFGSLPSVPPALGWFIMEAPCLVSAYYNFFLSPAREPAAVNSFPNRLLMFLFTIHYFNRVFVYPFLIRKTSSKFPLSVSLLGFFWTSQMGYLLTVMLCRFNPLGEDWITQPQFVVGVSLFLLGFILNIDSDSIVRNLRKPGETGYKIPFGGMFDFVSGANFFTELLEWFGFALAAGGIGGWTFFIVTFCNIGPRALSHHKWYLEKFKEDYPKDRKALIPYIW